MAMLTLTGNVQMDMRNMGIEDPSVFVDDGYFYDDVYEEHNGITYEDVVEASYSTYDGYGYLYIGGKGFGESGGSLTGTVTGILDEYHLDWGGYQGTIALEGISISMSDLEDAAATSSSADDVALFMNELSGNDVFTLGPYADYVDGRAGADRIKGNGGSDTLLGGTGNDTIDGGSGSDSMVGGSGNDLYVVNSASDRVVETSTSATEVDSVQAAISYMLGSNVERLTLTGTGNLSATGNGLSNSITGNSGNNVINGGLGNDTMIGGAAGDTYYVNSSRDVIVEASGGGTDIVLSNASCTLSSFVERLTLTGTPASNGTGNSSANVITGNNAANTIAGAAGNDTLTGRGGNDALVGGAGNDILTGGSGSDSFRFGSALSASTNVDRIVDFSGTYDHIELSRAVFTNIGATGQLSAGAFRQGTTAGDSTDRVIYDEATGKLLFDADGSGGGAAVLFANLAAGTDLTAADIFIV